MFSVESTTPPGIKAASVVTSSMVHVSANYVEFCRKTLFLMTLRENHKNPVKYPGQSRKNGKHWHNYMKLMVSW